MSPTYKSVSGQMGGSLTVFLKYRKSQPPMQPKCGTSINVIWGIHAVTTPFRVQAAFSVLGGGPATLKAKSAEAPAAIVAVGGTASHLKSVLPENKVFENALKLAGL
jgi:hypothetical protein